MLKEGLGFIEEPGDPEGELIDHKKPNLSQEFRAIAALCDEGPVNIDRILHQIRGRGEALLTLFLGGPFLLPIPLPGLSIPFGVLIAIFGVSLSTGWKPCLPRSWCKRTLPEDMVRRFCNGAVLFLARVEPFIKPRFLWIHENAPLKLAAGAMITCCGLLLALPLPPGTNAPPASAIVCLSIALLQGDGLLLLLGYLLFLLNAVFFLLIPIIGYKVLVAMLGISWF